MMTQKSTFLAIGVTVGIGVGIFTTTLVTSALARVNTNQESISTTSEQVIPPDPAEVRAQRKAAWRHKLATHESQPRDSLWALEKERRLKNSLAGLASQTGCQIAAVDCRTTTCVIDTRWDDRVIARQNLGAMLRHNYENDCGVEIVLPDAPDATGPSDANVYDAKVLVHCERGANHTSTTDP